LAENVRIPSYGERESQIVQKPSYDISTFPVDNKYAGEHIRFFS